MPQTPRTGGAPGRIGRRAIGVARRVRRRVVRSEVVRRVRGPALSVIVPFYNVEAYLAECLDSILAQGFDDFEVLLVDDGSPTARGGSPRSTPPPTRGSGS